MPGIVRVQRVTLPRYEVEFGDAASALEDARRVQQSRVLAIGHAFVEEVGTEVVVDVVVAGIAPSTTLLFRIVQKGGPLTVLEWWPRRKTDPHLLALFLESLEATLTSRAPSLPPGLSAEEQQQILELCRRALAHNPFTALGVHWTAGAGEIDAAASAFERTLRAFRARAGLSARGAELIDAALMHVPESRKVLATLDARQAARARFVPRDQLRHAVEIARGKLEVARLRGDAAAERVARAELAELLPRRTSG